MKKSILNLGTALNKVEQKEIFGGLSRDLSWEPIPICKHGFESGTCTLHNPNNCPAGYTCTPFGGHGGHGEIGNFMLTGICKCDKG